MSTRIEIRGRSYAYQAYVVTEKGEAMICAVAGGAKIRATKAHANVASMAERIAAVLDCPVIDRSVQWGDQ